ncbi:MAG: hypothetical protein K0R39_3644 [Symbiobacteriaceae bacterium]|jgi:uncharacterized protein (TIGR02271 family)|nr:hypothetical protein [Symbiobacteriaceae bacterium]
MVLAAAVSVFIAGRRRDVDADVDAEQRADLSMQLREEQVQVHKTREQLADVRTHTEVVRDTKTLTVPVTREEFVVEKDGAEVARIPLREEQVDVVTRMVPLNEVSVHEQAWTEDLEIETLVRKEVARVETSGEAEVREVP